LQERIKELEKDNATLKTDFKAAKRLVHFTVIQYSTFKVFKFVQIVDYSQRVFLRTVMIGSFSRILLKQEYILLISCVN